MLAANTIGQQTHFMLPSLASHVYRCYRSVSSHKYSQPQLEWRPCWQCASVPNKLRSRSARRQQVVRAQMQMDNRELLVGDCLSLVSFCLYKQITAIILMPSFPGWLAPMHFSPIRFEEFLSFAITVCGTWVGASLLVGGYKSNATSDLPTALARVSFTWLVSQPVAAAQLVLVTAAEGRSLVGATDFASVLPLAATGPGEPFATAAGVLGLMALWRAFYTVYLDFWNVRTSHGSPINRYQDMLHFVDALRSALFVSIAFCIVLQFLSSSIGEEGLEQMFAAFHF